jgi:aerobic-type carbon monoxide dehydrogenase small subunit (CoxS/CutS family)
MAIGITVNGQALALEEDGSLPLIFALRNALGLKGVAAKIAEPVLLSLTASFITPAP